MRLMCGNRTSTFFRSLRDWLWAAVSAIGRATSRDFSYRLRAILRVGVFGQQRGFIGHAVQACCVAR